MKYEKKISEETVLSLIYENRFIDAVDKADELLKIDKNNYNIYFLRALANILMNQIDEALLDLGEALFLNPRHEPSLEAVAYIFLKKEDYESAIKKWFNILEQNPENKIAKKYTKKFRKTPPSKASLNLNPLLYITMPKKPTKKSSFKTKTRILAIFFALLVSGLTVIFILKPTLPQKILDFSFLDKKETLFVFTDKEIDFYKKQIYDLINAQKYNEAKVLLNKIYLSNASLEDKKLLKTWETRLEYPKIEKIDKNYTPEEIWEKPELYHECFVLWQGEIISFIQKNKQLFFEILFSKDKKAQGFALFNYPIKEKDKVNVFAKIVVSPKKEITIEVFDLEKKQ